MREIKINNVTFDLISYVPGLNNRITIIVANTTLNDLETAAANGDGDIKVEDEFVGKGFSVLHSIMKIYGEEDHFEIILKQPSIEVVVSRHTDDIDVINEAIEELASIVAGGE